VGPGQGNMRHGGAIGLTPGRLAVVAGSGRAPARACGGGRRRHPRRLGERWQGGAVLGNKRALELHQHLLELLEWLASDEHGRGELAPSGGGHGGEEHAVVRGGREGGGV
jgi:hypothetical protein